jgi:hypothetical protein
MNIKDFGEVLTIDTPHVPQIEIVEVSVIPTWLKWVCGLGALALLFFVIRDFIKTAESNKRLKEFERLRLLNDEIIASKIVAEVKLNYYGLK